VKLRHPNPGDREQILALGKRLHGESWYADFDFDPETLWAAIAAAETDPCFLGLVLADADEQIVGFLLAGETNHFFGRDRYACDLALYVAPEHRGGSGFVRMIRAYEAWCRIRGVKEIQVGVSSDVASQSTVAMYQRMGYRLNVFGLRKKCVWPE
jgi:GNAT superfamily N-acetyltransferase